MSIAKPQLSVCLDDLQMETRAAMDAARRLGFRAIDVSAVRGPISPEELSATGCRHLVKHLSDLGLRLGSLRGPTGPGGFADPRSGEQRLEQAGRIAELAAAIGVPIVSLTLGQVSIDDVAQSSRLREALAVLAGRADHYGVTFGIETTGIGVAELGRLLREINCAGLAACCDSGAMLMRGDDPHQLLDALGGRLLLARIRDARAGSASESGHEVRLGEGDLDLPRLLAALDEAGLSGDLIVSRSNSAKPVEELSAAREAIERYMT